MDRRLGRQWGDCRGRLSLKEEIRIIGRTRHELTQVVAQEPEKQV